MPLELKDTLNLPKTAFSMKANLPQNEPKMLARWEAEGLWHHEVEIHALTAQNGAAQSEAPFLSSGGPRTTRTQEGLAVFAELYNRVLTVRPGEAASHRGRGWEEQQ